LHQAFLIHRRWYWLYTERTLIGSEDFQRKCVLRQCYLTLLTRSGQWACGGSTRGWSIFPDFEYLDVFKRECLASRADMALPLGNQTTSRRAIFQYINGFHNPRRRHSSLGGKSPLAFDRKAAEMS